LVSFARREEMLARIVDAELLQRLARHREQAQHLVAAVAIDVEEPVRLEPAHELGERFDREQIRPRSTRTRPSCLATPVWMKVIVTVSNCSCVPRA